MHCGIVNLRRLYSGSWNRNRVHGGARIDPEHCEIRSWIRDRGNAIVRL